MSSKKVYLNGRVWNPFSGQFEVQNILVANQKIAGLGYLPDEDEDQLEQIDLKNKWLIPFVIDSYVTLTEPGFEDRDTLDTLAKAANNGGIYGVLTTPSSEPCVDTPEMVDFLRLKASKAGLNAFPMGAITKQRQGKELAEMGLMSKAGAIAFTDDGPIEDPFVMTLALQYSKSLAKPLVIFPLDTRLHNNGVMNESYLSSLLGLKGSPVVAETVCISRDLQLLKHTGGHIHFFPVTCAESVSLIRDAKAQGLSVTCGTAPQYFCSDESAVQHYDSMSKCLPPLRSTADVTAIIDGIKDGTIDCIASHHEPTTVDDKRTDFSSAGFGISGLDVLVPLTITALYQKHNVPMTTILKCLTTNPIKIFKIPVSEIKLGHAAQFYVFDSKQEQRLTRDKLYSKSKNTPFLDQPLVGWCTDSIKNG